jgi:hypothetical protein
VGVILDEAARAVELEQAVRGIDSLDELALHKVLAAGLLQKGWGVFPEERYPADRGRRRRSEGLRCDLVLTRDGRPLLDERAQLELFRPVAACPLGEALWVEVKTVAQFGESGGNRAYASALQRPVWRDVAKLAAADTIRQAVVLLVLYTADDATADHDLGVWTELGRARGLPIGAPSLRRLTIGDRLGNQRCTAALFPLRA